MRGQVVLFVLRRARYGAPSLRSPGGGALDCRKFRYVKEAEAPHARIPTGGCMSCCPPLCLFHRPHPFLLVAWTAAENADLPAARANPTSDPPAPYKVTLGCPPLSRLIIEHMCRARPRFLPLAFPVAIAWCRTGDCV